MRRSLLLAAAFIMMTAVSCGRTVSRVNMDNTVSLEETQESSGMGFWEKLTHSDNKADKADNSSRDEIVAPEGGSIDDAEISEPIRETIRAAAESGGVMGRLFPAALVSAAESAEASGYMLGCAGVPDDGGKALDAYFSGDVLIKAERYADSGEIESAERIFSAYLSAFELLNSKGVTLEMLRNRGGDFMNGIADQVDKLLDPEKIRSSGERRIRISEMKYVTIETGGGISVIPMYKPKGEDWKVGAFLLSFFN